MRKSRTVFMIVVIIAACLFGAACAVYYYMSVPNDRIVPAFDEGKMNVVVEGEVVNSKVQAKIVDAEILLPFDVIKKYIDPNIYWDSKLHEVTITTKDRVIRMKTESLNAFVNNKPVTLNIPVVEEDGAILVPIEFLKDFYSIEISYLKQNDVIVIDFKNRVRQLADPVDAEAVVRSGRSVRDPIIRKLDSSDKNENVLRVFEEYEKWYKVRTVDGAVGYIEKKYVVVKLIMVQKMPEDSTVNTAWKPGSGKLNMAWDYTSGVAKNLSQKPKIEGLDVISPTWFGVVGEDGTMTNGADAKYVEWAHKNGYKVWALFSNNFNDANKMSSFLRNTDARDNTMRQLLAFAALYGLDGINIDFENLLDSDKDALTQFVREITPLLREQGLIVSIDINTLKCYDRGALGELVDYVALMAYDQHWSGGNEAGSVSQLSWVDSTVQNFLKVIPPEKLILGMPFYTREWKEEPGKNVTSQALSMDAAKKSIADNNAPVVWDDASGQFYAEYKKDGATFKIWLEDVNSINLRTSIALKYKLVGTAAWRMNFEVPEIWDQINRNLKVIASYGEWKQQNEGRKYTYAK